jgi:perosamine synthetase
MTSSGSAALITALKATRVPRGSEVMMPAICCPSVLTAIQFAGYKVVLLDIKLETLNTDLEIINEQMTERTSAIVAVHSFGRYCEIDLIAEFAKKNGLVLIEDACLALGGKYLGNALGSFGDVSILSFGYDKPIEINYGGALLTNNKNIFNTASEFITQNPFFGFNESTNDVSQILRKIDALDAAVECRLKNIQLLETAINNEYLLKLKYAPDIVYWRYPLLVKSDRGKFMKAAVTHGLLFTNHYLNLANFMTGLNLVNSNYVGSHIINIFVRPGTPLNQIKKSITFINNYKP